MRTADLGSLPGRGPLARSSPAAQLGPRGRSSLMGICPEVLEDAEGKPSETFPLDLPLPGMHFPGWASGLCPVPALGLWSLNTRNSVSREHPSCQLPKELFSPPHHSHMHPSRRAVHSSSRRSSKCPWGPGVTQESEAGRAADSTPSRPLTIYLPPGHRRLGKHPGTQAGGPGFQHQTPQKDRII